MKEILYTIIEIISVIHSKIMSLNDAYEYNFTDKQLHFLVIGILGMALVFAIHPIFLWLAKHKHIMTITWIYVFTLILVITFAIEIGQKVTNTGSMEFADIVFGIGGFVLMFLVFDIIRIIVKFVGKLLNGDDDDDDDEDDD